MPYIKEKDRKRLAKVCDPATPGELNFLFTVVIRTYIENKGLSYQTINDIVGALECCKLEAYRRVAVDYEEKKIDENGDVYE